MAYSRSKGRHVALCLHRDNECALQAAMVSWPVQCGQCCVIGTVDSLPSCRPSLRDMLDGSHLSRELGLYIGITVTGSASHTASP